MELVVIVSIAAMVIGLVLAAIRSVLLSFGVLGAAIGIGLWNFSIYRAGDGSAQSFEYALKGLTAFWVALVIGLVAGIVSIVRYWRAQEEMERLAKHDHRP